MRDDIHLRLGGPGSLRPADGTEGSGGDGVRVDTVGVDFQIRITVWPEDARQSAPGHDWTGFSVGTGIEIDLGLLGNQGAVFFNAGLELAFDRVATASGHRFRDIERYSNRPLRFARQRNHQRLDLSSRLAAISAADKIHMDADLR